MNLRTLTTVSSCLAAIVVAAAPAWAQEGKLLVRVKPTQAYVFVDNRAIGDGGISGFSRLLIVRMSPGEHMVRLYNYGYKPQTHKVTIQAKKTAYLEVNLEPIPGTTSGPWGRIQIEGGKHAAVLLNGKTPDFTVGQADEFNHDIGWKQELIVPPGAHELTLVRGDAPIWSGTVNVPAGKRVIVDVGKSGEQRVTDWPRGQKLSSLPPFHAGMASATVAVAPTGAQFSASPTQINCGESAKLTWSSTGAVENEISGIGKVATSGEQSVQPKQTTTYTLTAAGPGGKATPNATVNVNTGVQAAVNVSPAEIRYRRKGEKVLEQGSATVTWSATGADRASVDPFGAVSPSGSRSVQPTPKATAVGPLNETVTYTLRASNACGGEETRTATLRITGAIEPAISVEETTLLETRLAMNSIYFPTALPTAAAPDGGLVPSQQRALTELATGFKRYLEARPDAKLLIQAHADRRGSAEYNKALSERRAARARNFLMEQGVPAASLETVAYGSAQNLSEAEVKQLVEQNPNLTDQDRKKLLKNWRAIVLANNRRVDVMLSTTKQQSLRYFPLNVADFQELSSERRPTK